MIIEYSMAELLKGLVYMDIVKTKAVSELLGVSQTTIKRWASHFPTTFPKDHLGHYVFSEEQVSLLLYIQDRIEQGDLLDQITLPDQEQITPAEKDPLALANLNTTTASAQLNTTTQETNMNSNTSPLNINTHIPAAIRNTLSALGPVNLPVHEQETPLTRSVRGSKPKHPDSPDLPFDEMLSRLREVERSLGQKADEVVSAQVLQHRLELEELRKTVAQLAASFETMQNPTPKPLFTPQNHPSAAAEASAPRPKKKRFFLF